MHTKTGIERKRGFLQTAGVVMVAFGLSRVLGLARDVVLSSTFGVSAELDALTAAQQVTETVYVLVAGGALGSAFIPVFAGYLAREQRQTAWRVASAVINVVFLVTVLASLVTAVGARWIVSRVLAPGYDPATEALTVSLLRWMIASTAIFGVSGLLMGILNANDHFLLPALAPSMYNLGIIGGVLLLYGRWGVYSAAVGTLAGALLHLIVQLPALRNLGWHYAPILGLRLEGVRQVGRLMGPRVLGMAITQLNFWINTNLASRISVEGVVSALRRGWMLMLLPQAAFAQAVATVLFPSFAAQAARGERDAMRATLLTALRVLLYLTLPATAGLILLRRPLVEMLFMRGEFDARGVDMVAWALAWYALGLVAHSELEIITRAFYALHDTATPVWVGGGAMALNALLSLSLQAVFARAGSYINQQSAPWVPLGGLALANSLATTAETLVLAWLLRRRLGGLDLARAWSSAWRIILSTGIMCAALLAFRALVPVRLAWISGGGGMLVGGGVFLLSTLLLRSPEIDLVRRRWVP